jgi:hypothetical protein
VSAQGQVGHLFVADGDAERVGGGVEFGVYAQSGAGGGGGDGVETTTSWLVRGRARQLWVMWLNSRCSILFHFEVPGGKWQTVMASPVSAARVASSALNTRERGLFDPPASAVINSRVAVG